MTNLRDRINKVNGLDGMREALFKEFDLFLNKQGSKIAADSVTNNMFDAFQAAYQLQQTKFTKQQALLERMVGELKLAAEFIRGCCDDNLIHVDCYDLAQRFELVCDEYQQALKEEV